MKADLLAAVELLPTRTIIGDHADGETSHETVVVVKSEVIGAVNASKNVALADALLDWYDTTHGNGFGHDHHCPAPWNEQYHTQPIFDGCTCGWSDVQRAEQAR